ncbi:unnamed protein product [Pieris brassicae]|uniref:Uncharacterized protein n=1 Tax=Pieris brassicae TaxID=7116 RepID=A0A9P0TQG5_PIEBR|nr:unnamed protein product [Pieris brassicae]
MSDCSFKVIKGDRYISEAIQDPMLPEKASPRMNEALIQKYHSILLKEMQEFLHTCLTLKGHELKRNVNSLNNCSLDECPIAGTQCEIGTSPVSFANATKRNPSRIKNNKLKQSAFTVKTNRETEDIAHINKEQEMETNVEKENCVDKINERVGKYQGGKYPSCEFKNVGRSDVVEIQGAERNKFLHVWRLNKDTSYQCLEN